MHFLLLASLLCLHATTITQFPPYPSTTPGPQIASIRYSRFSTLQRVSNFLRALSPRRQGRVSATRGRGAGLATREPVAVIPKGVPSELRSSNSDRYVTSARDGREFTSIFRAYERSRNASGVVWALGQMRKQGVRLNTFSATAAINALSKAGCWKAAVSLFNQAIQESVTPDVRMYSAAIAACYPDRRNPRSERDNIVNDVASEEEWAVEREKKGRSEALRLYRRMLSDGIRTDPYVLAATISACTRGRHWEEALGLLDENIRASPKISAKSRDSPVNMVVLNAALSACETGGNSERAGQLIREARSRGLRVNLWSYNALISALASANGRENLKPDLGLDLLDDMAKNQLKGNVVSYTAAIKCSERVPTGWQVALRILDRMREEGIKPNLQAYTAALRCLSRQGQPEEKRLEIINAMKEEGIKPDSAMYAAIARAAIGSGFWMDAISCARDARATGLMFPRSLYTTTLERLLDSYNPSSSGIPAEDPSLENSENSENSSQSAEKSRTIRDIVRMMEEGELAVSDRFIGRAYARMQMSPGGPDESQGSVGEEISKSLRIGAFTSAIAEFGRMSRWRDALNTLNQARMYQNQNSRSKSSSEEVRGASLQAVTAAMGACQKARRWSETLKLLQDLDEEGVKLDTAAYALKIQALGMRGLRREAVKELTRMRREGVRANNMCYTAAILAADQVQNGDLAITVLRRMEENQLRVDQIAYNAAIKAQERCKGRWDVALGLIEEMREKGIEPSIVSYNALISACRRSENWQAALSIALSLGNLGMRADIITINAVISALEVGHKWQAALALAQGSSSRGMKLDTISYTALITACARAAVWEKAIQLLREMEEKEIEPNLATYSAVVAACDNAYQYDMAAEIENEANYYLSYSKYRGIPSGRGRGRGATGYETDPTSDQTEPEDRSDTDLFARDNVRSSFLADPKLWGKLDAKGPGKEVNEDRSDVRGASKVPNGRPFAYFGVYDGHGGASTSQWLKENLARQIDISWDISAVKDSMKAAYLEADRKILEPKGGILGTAFGAARGIGGYTCGASAATAVLYKTKEGMLNMVSANAGNSVILLKRGSQIHCLSELHIPENELEYTRIMALRNPNPKLPLIREKGGRLRLNGILGLTRAFGNAKLKPSYMGEEEEDENSVDIQHNREEPGFLHKGPPLKPQEKIKDYGLTAEPYVTNTQILESDEWIMVASNGLLDQTGQGNGLTVGEIDNAVEELRMSGGSPNSICNALAVQARKKGAIDDITIVFVPLTQPRLARDR